MQTTHNQRSCATVWRLRVQVQGIQRKPNGPNGQSTGYKMLVTHHQFLIPHYKGKLKSQFSKHILPPHTKQTLSLTLQKSLITLLLCNQIFVRITAQGPDKPESLVNGLPRPPLSQEPLLFSLLLLSPKGIRRSPSSSSMRV